MTFLITRLALQSSRRHVAVTRSWLTLQAFRVDNASINMNKLLHRGLSHDKNYQVSLPRIGTPATMLTRGRSADKSRCLSSMPHKKVSTAQQLADHLDMVNLVSSNSEYQTARMSSGDISKIERLISRYLIVIATEPVINPRNIVDIFELYAKTGRPLMHDMHAFRDEFQRLGPVSEKALSTMTYTDLQQLARSLSFLRNQDLKLVSRLIQALCHECSSRVNTAPFQEGIKYFEIVHHFFGIRQPFYAIFSEYFCLHVDEASEKELIKLMHFCTRKQKTADAVLVQKALNRLENSLDSVSFVTLGVVADSVAKSGVELNRDLPLIQKIAPTLVAHVTEDKKWTGLEMYAVHSIVNLFRLSRFMDENVTSAIEHLLLNCEDSCLDAETIPGFLAFLASRSYHEDVFTRLENLIVLLLKSDLSLTLKLADLARIVWAFSSTNHKCSDEFVSLVFSNFHSMCALDKLNHNFLKFIDALQSLTMMGHINHHLASLAFEPLKGRALGYKNSGPMFTKLVKRISVLHHCMSIEVPDFPLPPLETSPSPDDISLELERRPALSALFDQLKHLNEYSKDGAVVFLGRPITSVAVASVCLDVTAATRACSSIDGKPFDAIDEKILQSCSKLGTNVSIEVLDDTCTMKDVQLGRRSTGLVSFKTRLLEKLEWKHLFVSGCEIEQGVLSKKKLLDQLESLS